MCVCVCAVDPEIKAIISLMRKMKVSVIRINNITHLFLTWFEQYFYLPGNTFKQPVQQPLRPPPPPPPRHLCCSNLN